MKGKMAIAQSKIRFEEVFDPFPSEDDVMDDSCLGPKYKELAKDLFGETEERMIVLIKEFKEATKKDGIDIPDSDLFCRRFLRAGGCDVDEALKVLHSYLSVYKLCPHYYEDMLPMGKNDKAYKAQINMTLLHRDKYGRRVYIWKAGRWEPNKIPYGMIYSAGYSMMELISLEPKTQVAGVTMIMDANGYGYKHFTAISMTDMKMSFKLMENGFPLWFRVMHVLNAPRLAITMYNIMKPFLGERIKV